jgi:hypothetical protein
MNVKFRDNKLELTISKDWIETNNMKEYVEIVEKILLFLNINSLHIYN